MDKDLQRMRWASRRGMLELDLVLEPYVSNCYANLPEPDRERYRALMSCEDQQLFGWFLGRETPDDPELATMVLAILDFHRSRGSPGGLPG